MAWKIEFSRTAERELDKLDPQAAKRILKVLHDRIAKADDPRSFSEALKGSNWASSGNTASAITG